MARFYLLNLWLNICIDNDSSRGSSNSSTCKILSFRRVLVWVGISSAANLGETSLAKGTARSDDTYFPRFFKYLLKHRPDWIILANLDLLSFLNLLVYVSESILYFNLFSCCLKELMRQFIILQIFLSNS